MYQILYFIKYKVVKKWTNCLIICYTIKNIVVKDRKDLSSLNIKLLYRDRMKEIIVKIRIEI